eukprot:3385218-Pleurochrysis_carterae.AAC.3
MVQRICNSIREEHPRRGIRGRQTVGTEPGLEIWHTGLLLMKVVWCTANRLGEALKTSSGLTYFVRLDVSFRIKGVLMTGPSACELESMTDGDVVHLEASRSETDFAASRTRQSRQCYPNAAKKSGLLL